MVAEWLFVYDSHDLDSCTLNPQYSHLLNAIALMYNGIRETLPFVCYMVQFIDFEFKFMQ